MKNLILNWIFKNRKYDLAIKNAKNPIEKKLAILEKELAILKRSKMNSNHLWILLGFACILFWGIGLWRNSSYKKRIKKLQLEIDLFKAENNL